jgi:hypothetical protein
MFDFSKFAKDVDFVSACEKILAKYGWKGSVMFTNRKLPGDKIVVSTQSWRHLGRKKTSLLTEVLPLVAEGTTVESLKQHLASL